MRMLARAACAPPRGLPAAKAGGARGPIALRARARQATTLDG